MQRSAVAVAAVLGGALACALSLGACGGQVGASPDAGPGAGGGDAGRLRPAPEDGGPGSTPIPDEMEECTPEELAGRSWCDPATWGGMVPDATSDVSIPSGVTVVVDCAAQARTVDIEAGGVLRASHTSSSTLTLGGNLVVRGRLEVGRPGCRIPEDLTAEIVFTGMRDGDYVGTPTTAPFEGDVPGERVPPALTPMAVIASDVGLWVVDQGVVSAAGAIKRSWSFLTEGAAPGDGSFSVLDASGWRAGDRVVLTPTAMRAEPNHTVQFDEGAIANASGATVALAAAPAFTHAGCTDCMRRGEAIDLTRNVVVRSADDTGHAHVMVAQQGILQLDSVELRSLGPEWPADSGHCGGPARRAPIWFHQQVDASYGSFVRHVSIWGGQSHFVMIERSHGIEMLDVAGYDTFGNGIELFFDSSNCGTRCEHGDAESPRDVLMTDVLVAKVGIGMRESGCARIEHRGTGIAVGGGGERSGCLRCVTTGIGYVGSGADVAGFTWHESGAGRPLEFTFNDNVAHNNANHGAFIWQNASQPQAPYERNAFWSNDGHGIHWGAYSNAFVLQDFVAVDNGRASVGVKAVPRDDRPRLDGATLDDLAIQAYVLVQERPNILRDLSFTGVRPIAMTQIHDRCTAGHETDPNDPDCTRIWLRIENPVFASGVRPFDFGWTFNLHSVWEVRGFSHPDSEYADLPASFDLYRSDNHVAGGHQDDRFDAWLVPR